MLGRVMSFIIMAALGLTPLSYGLTSLFISSGIKVQTIMMCSSILLLLAGPFVYFKVPALRNEQ
jgi:hypothetical protein